MGGTSTTTTITWAASMGGAATMIDITRTEVAGTAGTTVEETLAGRSTVGRASSGWRRATAGRRIGASFLTHRAGDTGTRREEKRGGEEGTPPPHKKSCSLRNQYISMIFIRFDIVLMTNKWLISKK